MTLFRWLSTAFSPARKRPIRVRLNVERLEDRLTPTAGLLDPTFGAGAGYVLSSLNPPDAANAVAVQSNGKIVIAGSAVGIKTSLVARYNADGSLDTSFGSGGYTTTSFRKALTTQYFAVAIQSDGKILAGGFADPSGADDFALVRYNANGTLDTTFGNNGEVLSLAGGIDSIAVQTDGKIVVGGKSGAYAALARYNANGTLDTTFGNGGELVTNIRIYGGPKPDPVLIQPDGKIVLAGGMTDPTSGQPGWGVARFNTNGAVDSSFGNGGEAVILGGGNLGFDGVALQADGKIVVDGSANPAPGVTYLALGRINADGTLDTTFGSSGTGVVTVPGPAGFPLGGPHDSGVEIQSDGKIVAVAGLNNSSQTAGLLGAARVNANGTLDTSYGNGGWATSPIGGDGASALQPDGRLLIAGSTVSDVTLIRFTGDTTSASFSVSGFPSSVTAGAAGTVTVTALNPDGSVNTGYTGTVHFTSSDPHAVLPADYTFTTGTGGDNGMHTFNATLLTAGIQSILATDTTTSTMLGGEAGIQVNPAATSQFLLSAPSSVRHGSAFSLTLTVEDAYGNVVTGYVGTVHFTSSDSTATLPANYTFTTSDAGVHTFSNLAILLKRGTQTVTVTDMQNSTLTAHDSINVT